MNLTANTDGGAWYNFISSSTNAGTEHWRIWGGAATSNLAFNTGGSERMRINASGELLIGTTSDAGAYALQVAGSIYNTTGAVLAASSGGLAIGGTTLSSSSKLTVTGGRININTTDNTSLIAFENSGTIFASIGDGQVVTAADPGSLAIRTNTGALMKFLTDGNNERMRITSAAELLIATTSDAGDYKLQVNGNERKAGKLDVITTTEYGVNLGRSGTSATAFQAYNSTAAMAVGIESSTGGGLFTGTSAYAAVFGNANNYPTQFITNNAVRATITNTGRLGVGTTSPGYDIHAYQSATVAQIGVSASTNTGTYLQQATNGTGMLLNIDSARLYFGTDNATMMHLNPSGELIVNSEADNGDYKIQVNGNAVFYGTITTNQPTDGTARPWKLGEYVTTAPTATGYVQVEINGVKYKILAATY
jgi:hypothetical protein